ncbi:MAG: hypothetical protein IJQ79_10945 [Bacteroidales bacterium]|nr:hypothetical protein [Bacteroidales bacterium]
MAEKNTNKSEYTQKVEALTKQLQELAEAEKANANTGIIVISVHVEDGADHEEVVLSMCGRHKPLVRGLVHFADANDEDMSDVFLEAVKVMAAKESLRRLHHLMGKVLAENEKPETGEEETKTEE